MTSTGKNKKDLELAFSLRNSLLDLLHCQRRHRDVGIAGCLPSMDCSLRSPSGPRHCRTVLSTFLLSADLSPSLFAVSINVWPTVSEVTYFAAQSLAKSASQTL